MQSLIICLSVIALVLIVCNQNFMRIAGENYSQWVDDEIDSIID